MTRPDDHLIVARVTSRGVAVLLALLGVALLMASGRGDPARFLTGFALVAVAAGIWRQQRWARWLALGACFLMIVVACVIPVLMFLVLPLRGFDGGMRMTLLWVVVCLAFGTAGYKGLGYFRSEKGRLDFAGEDAVAQHSLMGETSAAVVWSAGVWVLLLGFAWSMGLGTPSWLFWHIQPEEPRRDPRTTPLEYTYFEVQRDQRRFEGNDPASARFRVTPDIIPLGLCARSADTRRPIDLAYANVGGGRGYRSFRLTSSTDTGEHPSPELLVPDPDTLAIASLGLPSGGRDGYVYVNVDQFNDLVESDETNNAARFRVTDNLSDGETMPTCDALRLRFRNQPGPTRTAATVEPLPTRPDLVPLGLCISGDRIRVEFTNKGAAGLSTFLVAQGNATGSLRVVSRAWLSVPAPQAVAAFTLGPVATLLGKRGSSTTLAVELDAMEDVIEMNETNNYISTRVTRSAGGTVDLPQCQQLDPGGNTIVVDESIPPEAAGSPLPDLVALGGCFAGNGHLPGFMVVFGNAGPVASPQPFRLFAGMRGGSLEGRMQPNSFSPGMTWSQYFNTDPRPGDILELKIDTENQVAESNESNNTLTIEVRGPRGGTADFPVCPPSARLADWKVMMQARKGN